MQNVTEHPQGTQCIAALFAVFDPSCERIGLNTIPWYETEDVATWYFAVDTDGDEVSAGTICITGFAAVQKHNSFITIVTSFPLVTVSIIQLFDTVD